MTHISPAEKILIFPFFAFQLRKKGAVHKDKTRQNIRPEIFSL